MPSPGKLRTKLGKLRLSKNRIKLGNILNSEVISDTILIKNTATVPMKISFGEHSDILQIYTLKDSLKPQEKGKIVITLDPTQGKKYGLLDERIPLTVEEGNRKRNYAITVSATILEDFSYLTEKERKKAPKIQFEGYVADVGVISKKESKTVEFYYKNIGKNDLIIRTIDVPMGVSVIAYDKVLKKNRKGTVKLEVKPKYFRAKLNFVVNVFSNDPNRSMVSLKIIGKMNRKENTKLKNSGEKVEKVSPLDAYKIINENFNDILILDIRSEKKYNDDHIKHAINLDFNAENFKDLLNAMDKNKILLIYDDEGVHGEKILKTIEDLEFKKVYYLAGGFHGWKKENLSLSGMRKNSLLGNKKAEKIIE